MQVAVQEVRRLQKYGVTSGELERYKAALIRDSEHVAEQWESVPSVDTLDYCMECLALNHTFMAQEDVCHPSLPHPSLWLCSLLLSCPIKGFVALVCKLCIHSFPEALAMALCGTGFLPGSVVYCCMASRYCNCAVYA